ncbi:non-specific lipid-transfer protein-like [Argentina anserina]|uniref:non-specific lipid-transfer protein-like n=1 Tax=Argentina anserina TaxID=57926 RepID=UPI00217671DC|nr:non-specific lipid-transfer protein-like [Potentilla anserina]
MAFAGLVTMVIVLNASPTIGECYGALVELLPCATFVMGPGLRQPPEMCCSGMQHVVAGADTTEKRRSLCQCLKDHAVAASVKVDPAKIKHATEVCGVEIPILLDPNVDCSKIDAFERDQVELDD